MRAFSGGPSHCPRIPLSQVMLTVPKNLLQSAFRKIVQLNSRTAFPDYSQGYQQLWHLGATAEVPHSVQVRARPYGMSSHSSRASLLGQREEWISPLCLRLSCSRFHRPSPLSMYQAVYLRDTSQRLFPSFTRVPSLYHLPFPSFSTNGTWSSPCLGGCVPWLQRVGGSR